MFAWLFAAQVLYIFIFFPSKLLAVLLPVIHPMVTARERSDDDEFG